MKKQKKIARCPELSCRKPMTKKREMHLIKVNVIKNVDGKKKSIAEEREVPGKYRWACDDHGFQPNPIYTKR